MSEPATADQPRDIATVADGVRHGVTLIACIPDPIKREGYVQFLANRAGYDSSLIRREVDKTAATGNAREIYAQILRGEKPSASRLQEKRADQLAAGESAAPTGALGWWERPIGRDDEGRIVEDSGEFMYRRYQRLPIVQALNAWGRLWEWFGRVEDERHRNADQTLFAAEFTAWCAMRDEQRQNPLYREQMGLDAPDLEAEQDAEDEAVWGRDGLVDRIFDLDAAERAANPDGQAESAMPWLSELYERREAGQGDREAAAGTLALAAKAGRVAEPGLHLRTPWKGTAKVGG